MQGRVRPRAPGIEGRGRVGDFPAALLQPRRAGLHRRHALQPLDRREQRRDYLFQRWRGDHAAGRGQRCAGRHQQCVESVHRRRLQAAGVYRAQHSGGQLRQHRRRVYRAGAGERGHELGRGDGYGYYPRQRPRAAERL